VGSKPALSQQFKGHAAVSGQLVRPGQKSDSVFNINKGPLVMGQAARDDMIVSFLL